MRYLTSHLSAPLFAADPAILSSVAGQLSEAYRAAHRRSIPDAELQRRLTMVRTHNGRTGLVLPIPRYIAKDPFGRDELATDDHFITIRGALALLDSSDCPLAELDRRRAATTNTKHAKTA